MVTQWIFAGLVCLLAAQRLAELRLSGRNERWLREQGAVEAGERLMPRLRLMHGAWLVAMIVEVFLLDRPFIPLLAAVAALGVLTGQVLRYAAIRELGVRWTVRVLVLPGSSPVVSGIYRRVRHPNYLGVILEILFVPLLHTAWITAIVFTILNAIALRSRIRSEEEALREVSDYDGAFRTTPRLVPAGRLRD